MSYSRSLLKPLLSDTEKNNVEKKSLLESSTTFYKISTLKLSSTLTNFHYYSVLPSPLQLRIWFFLNLKDLIAFTQVNRKAYQFAANLMNLPTNYGPITYGPLNQAMHDEEADIEKERQSIETIPRHCYKITLKCANNACHSNRCKECLIFCTTALVEIPSSTLISYYAQLSGFSSYALACGIGCICYPIALILCNLGGQCIDHAETNRALQTQTRYTTNQLRKENLTSRRQYLLFGPATGRMVDGPDNSEPSYRP